MKKQTIIGALAVLLILVVGASAFALQNRVRWNPMLEECVYYYTPPTGLGSQCFVDEKNCEGKSYEYAFKNVDAKTSYYVPRKDQPSTPTQCQEFTEGDKIVLDYSGSDPDKGVGPAGKLVYTLGKPFDSQNTWQTKRGDAGSYNVKIKVSDGELEDEQELCFTILSGNHPPILEVKDITADEGEKIVLRPQCADADGDALKLSYDGDMTSDTWQTGFDDAGTHKVTVTCAEVMQGGLSDTQIVHVTVQNVNREPSLSVGSVTVREGETATLKPSCTDPEGSKISLSYSGAMKSATWTTGYDDAGEYTVVVSCADAEDKSVKANAKVTVLDRNRAPQITAVLKKA